LLFSLVNNFIKPFVVILVGQLLIRTMGFFLLVVNAAMFFVLIGSRPLLGMFNSLPGCGSWLPPACSLSW
jgi:uncharacterized membrane protein YvlD (DUF360 family)